MLVPKEGEGKKKGTHGAFEEGSVLISVRMGRIIMKYFLQNIL